jgi:hypothetical protein
MLPRYPIEFTGRSMSPMPLPGDANENREFDQLDIVQVLQLAKVSLLVFLGERQIRLYPLPAPRSGQ